MFARVIAHPIGYAKIQTQLETLRVLKSSTETYPKTANTKTNGVHINNICNIAFIIYL
jgi:hypothetical protein